MPAARMHPVWESKGGPMVVDGAQVKCAWKEDDGTVKCTWKQALPKSGSYSPTNLAYHVESAHKKSLPINWAEFEKKILKFKKDRAGGDDSTSQPCIDSIFENKKKFSAASASDAKRIQAINQSLTKMVGTNPHLAYSLVGDQAFKEFVRALNPRFELPSRYTIARNIQHYSQRVLDKIRMEVLSLDKGTVNVCIDMWTRRGGTPFMGIVISYWNPDVNKIVVRTVALTHFPGSHTAKAITEKFLSVWTDGLNYPVEAIGSICSDSASNCVSAFRDIFSKIAADKALAERNAELEEEEELEEEVVQLIPQWGLEDEAPEEEGEEDWDKHDALCRKIAEDIPGMHIRCYIHLIQCSITSGKKVEGVRDALRRWSEFVGKVRGKRAGEDLKAEAGIQLQHYVKTRWTSEKTMMRRLLDAKPYLATIMDRLNKPNLSVADWDLMQDMLELLEPFGTFVERMQTSGPAMAFVIPFTMCLKRHLSAFKFTVRDKSNRTTMTEFRDKMMDDMLGRFQYILDPESEGFMPIYAVATLLDPRTSATVPKDLLQPAVDFIMEKLSKPEDEEEEEAAPRPSSVVTPPTKVCRADELMAGLLFGSTRGSASATSSPGSTTNFQKNVTDNTKLEKQLSSFMDESYSISNNEDPLTWWEEHTTRWPKLANYARHTISIVPGSSSVEREFSASGKVLGMDRHRLSAKALEAEVIITTNKNICNVF